MKKIFLALLLLPAVISAQSTFWYSGGGAVYIDRTFNHLGYGIEASANAEIFNGFSLGVGMGVSKIPILPKAYMPLYGKATFFPSLNESRLAPFATVEVGYGIYSDNDSQKGNALAFGGVGFSIETKKRVDPYISFGYGVYGYTFSNGNPATQRRANLKFGVLFNRNKTE